MFSIPGTKLDYEKGTRDHGFGKFFTISIPKISAFPNGKIPLDLESASA